MTLFGEGSPMAKKRGRVASSPKPRSARHRNWSFEIRDYDEQRRLLLIEPIRYIAHGLDSDGKLLGVICFKHQLAMPYRHLPKGALLLPLPRDTLQEAIETLKNDFGEEMDELGTRPMTQKEKAYVRFKPLDDAVDAAKEGRWDDIPNRIWLKYGTQLNAIKSVYHPDAPK